MNTVGMMKHAGQDDGFDPQIEYRPAVYWFWSRIPSPDEINDQLSAIREAGYGTFLIQARLSFPRREYLSEAFLEACRLSMIRARALGLKAGLYDDYNWISGHAGGRTVAGCDHLRERHLFWTTAETGNGPVRASVSGIQSLLVEGLGPAVQNWCYEGVPEWGDWEIFRAYLCPPSNVASSEWPVDITSYGTLTPEGPDGCRLNFLSLPDSYPGWRLVAFVTARCVNSRLINYLHPQAGKRFIEVGYEPYKRALGEFFGDPLSFVFWDQPYAGFYNWRERTGNVVCSLMFDPGLADLFEQTRGYPLDDALLGLVLPDSDQSPRLRCDFFETYGRLARHSFLGPITDWARDNGLEAAGHELLGFVGSWAFAGGLTDMDSRVNFGADYFAIDRYKTLSAVDACNFHPQISARFGSSVAKSHGRRGCLIEQYAVPRDPNLPSPVGQWGLTLAELRAQAIRHTLQGARQFIFHAFYQSDGRDAPPDLMTNPGLDFPPGINFEPWYPDHARLSRELAGLSEFMAGADTHAPVAVLYPLRTFWHAGGGHAFNRESALWNQWLYEHGPAFDIVDENELLADQAAGGNALEQYQALILPGSDVISGMGFVDLIEDFTLSGGWVIATGPLPEASQEKGRDPELSGRVRAFLENSDHAFHWPSLTLPFDDRHPAVRFFQDRIDCPVRVSWEGTNRPAVRIWTGLTDADSLRTPGWRVALFNDGAEACRLAITLEGTDAVPEEWDTESGEHRPWAWWSRSDRETRVFADMEPNELRLFQFSPNNYSMPGRLERVSETVESCRAFAEPDGELAVTFQARWPGPVVLEVAGPDKPRVNASPREMTASAFGPGQWALRMDMPEPPTAVVLDEGWRFRPDHQEDFEPVDVRQGWEVLYPDYSGVGHYECRFDLPDHDPTYDWALTLPRVVTTAGCLINGTNAGRRCWHPYTFILSGEALLRTDNHLVLEISNTGANSYYFHTPFFNGRSPSSGMVGAPLLEPVVRARMRVSWEPQNSTRKERYR